MTSRSHRFLRLAAAALLAAAPAAVAQEIVDGRSLLRKIDDLWRGTSSAAEVSMTIQTKNWKRTLEMRLYSKGQDLSLVRIILPKKEAGTATLMAHDNVWNYLPKTRRVMKVPSSMMMGSWMGSHFTNDDLVRESRLEEDYEFTLSEKRSADGEDLWQLTLLPRPDAAVVWGKLVVDVRKDLLLPIQQLYYDEDGELVRRAVFEDFELIGERVVPMTMRMEPVDKPGELTEVRYQKLLFDVDLDDSLFSLQNLKR